MKKMMVYSNADLVNRSDQKIQFIYSHSEPRSWMAYILSLPKQVSNLKKSKVDAYLIFNPQFKDALAFYLFKILGGNAKVFYFDILLKKPINKKEKLFSLIKKEVYSKCDRFICVHRDTSAYKRYFGVTKTFYIPFKSNNFEIHHRIKTLDKGYVLSCGVSHRDYETLFKAVEDLDFRVVVALPNDKDVTYHQASLGRSPIPKNVEIVRHDFNKDTWNDLLANASFVVIPIDKDCIQPAGISVYLEAMMLKKATIVSDGPSTVDLIDNGQALIVPRGDHKKLRGAIKQLWNDDGRRKELEVAGYDYAINLAGVDRLVDDLKSFLNSCDSLNR